MYSELLRQLSWSRSRLDLMHYRERNGSEIDIVIENRRRELVGIEVKAAIEVGGRDVRPLAQLCDRIGDRFVAGIVLYCGSDVLELGDRIRGLPISALWADQQGKGHQFSTGSRG